MVAHERLRGLGPELALLLGVAEAAAPPARLQQPEQRRQPGLGAAAVVALEDLVDEDPEALVHRRLARDPEDAGELVLQRARPVGLDVGRAQQQPAAAPGQERLQRRLVARGHGARAQPLVALGVQQVVVQRRRQEDLALLGRGGLQQAHVDLGQRLLHRQLARARALQQRGELDQLQVAHDGVGDVEVGVEAQLAEPAADLGDGRQQLVAQQPERRLQRLRRPEQLLLARLPLAADGGARLLGERRRLLGGAAVGALRVGEHEPAARAGHRHVQQPPHLRGVGGARQRRDGLLDAARPGSARASGAAGRASAPTSARARRRARTRGPWRRASSSRARRARTSRRPPPPRAARRRRRRRSSGRTRARWPAVRGARSWRRSRRSARGSAGARRPRWWPRTAAGGAARAARSAGARRGPAGRSPASRRRRGRA